MAHARTSTMGIEDRFVDHHRAPIPEEVRRRPHAAERNEESWAKERSRPGDVHVFLPQDKFVPRRGTEQHYRETSQAPERHLRKVDGFGDGAREKEQRRVPVGAIMKSASQVDYTVGHVDKFTPRPGATMRNKESEDLPARPGRRVAGFLPQVRQDHVGAVFAGKPATPDRSQPRQRYNNPSQESAFAEREPVPRGKRVGLFQNRSSMSDIMSHNPERRKVDEVGVPRMGGPHKTSQESEQPKYRGKAIPVLPLDHVATVLGTVVDSTPHRRYQSKYVSGSQTERIPRNRDHELSGGIGAHIHAPEARVPNRKWDTPKEDITDDWFQKFSARQKQPRGVKRYESSAEAQRQPAGWDRSRNEQEYPSRARGSAPRERGGFGQSSSQQRLNQLIDESEIAQQRERRQQWRQQQEERDRLASEAILAPPDIDIDEEDHYWAEVVQKQERRQQQQQQQRATPPNPRRHLRGDGVAASVAPAVPPPQGGAVAIQLAHEDYDMWLKFQQWQQMHNQQSQQAQPQQVPQQVPQPPMQPSPPQRPRQISQWDPDDRGGRDRVGSGGPVYGGGGGVRREHPAVGRWSTGLRNLQGGTLMRGDSLEKFVSESPARGSPRRRGR